MRPIEGPRTGPIGGHRLGQVRMGTQGVPRVTARHAANARFEQVARGRAAGVVSLAVLMVVLFVTPVVLQPAYVDRYYLALVLTVLTVLPLAAGIASRTLDIFEPIIPVSLLIGLAYGVRTMYLAYAPNTLLLLQPNALRFDDFIAPALVLTIAAYCSLLVGYYVIAGPMRLAPLSTWTFAHRKWPASTLNGTKVAGLVGLAAIATLTNLSASDSVTSATTFIATLQSFGAVGACILALYIAAGDDRRWLRVTLWCGAIPLGVYQSLAFGAKAPLLLMFYVVIASWHYAKRPIGPRALLAGAVVAVLLVFPVVNEFRAEPDRLLAATGSGTTSAEFIGRVRSIPALFTQMTPGQYVQLAAEGVIARSTGVDTLAGVLKYDVSVELGNPTAYLYIPFYAFIPRVIWPSKPVLDQGTRFGRLLLVPSSEGRNSISSFGIFHIGDLFVSFGIAGVLIGMALLGCLYRLLYRFFDPMHTADLGLKFIYIFLLWNVVNGFESDIPSVYANTLKSLAVWVLLKIWFNAPSIATAIRRPAAGARPWAPRPRRPVPDASRALHPGAARSGIGQ